MSVVPPKADKLSVAAKRRALAPKQAADRMQLAVGADKSEVRIQTREDRCFITLNIEPQNKKPQNDEVITAIFEIPCSIFCGSSYHLPGSTKKPIWQMVGDAQPTLKINTLKKAHTLKYEPFNVLEFCVLQAMRLSPP